MTSRKPSWQVEHWHFSILCDEDNILDLAQHGSDKEFDDRKNDFNADGCSDCSSYYTSDGQTLTRERN